jgi:hypothetical protein
VSRPRERQDASAESVREALADVAALGPFFAVSDRTGQATGPGAPRWRPCRDLYTDPSVLEARIRVVAGAVGTTGTRVAASIAFQGLAARLVSPVLAVAAVHRLVPPWSPDGLRWRAVASGPWPLAPSAGPPRHAGESGLVAAVAATLVGPHLAALVGATRAVASVSDRVLWGNAASALVGATAIVVRARPASARTASVVLRGLLATGPLAGTGGFGPRGSFRRRSCCLYYRVPGGGICGDCVLAAPGRSGGRASPAVGDGD